MEGKNVASSPEKGGAGYPLWFRDRVLADLAGRPGATATDRVTTTAEHWQVGEAQIWKWKKRREDTGSAERAPKTGGRPRKIKANLEALLLLMMVAYPDSYDDEYAATLSSLSSVTITEADVRRVFERHNVTRKKIHKIASESDPELVQQFHASPLPDGHLGTALDDLIDVDESFLILVKAGRKYGRALRGKPATVVAKYRKGLKLTIYLAIGRKGMVAYWVCTQHATEQAFAEFIELFLFPKLDGHKVVMMDNLRSHKAQAVTDVFATSNHQALYRPPYTPQIAPIETYFDLLKDKVKRRIRDITEANAIRKVSECCEELPDDATDLFRHCGYRTEFFY